MKRIALLSALALCLAAFAPKASAQVSDDKNHGNFGVFFNMTRPENTNTNFFGVGARLGFNVARHVVLEGEMAYAFERNVSSTPTGGIGGTTTRYGIRGIRTLLPFRGDRMGEQHVGAIGKSEIQK